MKTTFGFPNSLPSSFLGTVPSDGYCPTPHFYLQPQPAGPAQSARSPRKGPCAWGLTLCDCHLESLNHFIFESVFLEVESEGTVEHVLGAWSLAHTWSHLGCPRRMSSQLPALLFLVPWAYPSLPLPALPSDHGCHPPSAGAWV